MAVDAPENAFVAREVEGDERKYRGKRGRVKFIVDLEFVGHERENTAVPLYLLEDGGFEIHEFGIKYGLQLPLNLIELRFVIGIDGDIDTDIKETFLCLLELVAKVLEILIGDVEFWISDKTLLLTLIDLALHFRNLLLKSAKNKFRLDRVNHNRNIVDLVEIDDWREPVLRKEARIGNNKKCS